jgi:copper chaperone for superoxide dismutase/copper chaperone
VAKALPESTKRELYGLQDDEFTQKVFGIARFVQIAPRSILLDLTVRLPPSQNAFRAYVAKTGNLVDPPVTTKGAHVDLGTITPDKDGYGDLFKEVDGAQPLKDVPEGSPSFPAGSVFAGVVARSAGTWGNDKTVCACSGRTMWEEGREMEAQAKGML